MREEYDFSDGIKNPYAAKLKNKQQITININTDTDIHSTCQSLRSNRQRVP